MLEAIKRRMPQNLRGIFGWFGYELGEVKIKCDTFDYIVVDECKFYVNDQIDSVQRVKDNPWFANIRPTDIALDIGANIGAIAIPLAKVARRVYAVEPVWYAELLKNIELNNLDNISTWQCGIGKDFGREEISFGSKTSEADIYPLAYIKDMIGLPIDFIKIDCEGAEWCIEPEELEGIRELRLELHIRRHSRDRLNYEKWMGWIKSNGYKFITNERKHGILTGESFHRDFSECIVVNASKEQV